MVWPPTRSWSPQWHAALATYQTVCSKRNALKLSAIRRTREPRRGEKRDGQVRTQLTVGPGLFTRETGVEDDDDAEADMPSAETLGAICVQKFDDSHNSAIHTTYRISLRSSSLREPRYPLLRVVFC